MIYGDVCLVHNGIVVNTSEICSQHSEIKLSTDVDSEVIAALLHVQLQNELNFQTAVKTVFDQKQMVK